MNTTRNPAQLEAAIAARIERDRAAAAAEEAPYLHPLAGTIITRGEGIRRRYWLAQTASGPATPRMIERAISDAAVTGSVGATYSLRGDNVEPSSVTVVELVPRKAGA